MTRSYAGQPTVMLLPEMVAAEPVPFSVHWLLDTVLEEPKATVPSRPLLALFSRQNEVLASSY